MPINSIVQMYNIDKKQIEVITKYLPDADLKKSLTDDSIIDPAYFLQKLKEALNLLTDDHMAKEKEKALKALGLDRKVYENSINAEYEIARKLAQDAYQVIEANLLKAIEMDEKERAAVWLNEQTSIAETGVKAISISTAPPDTELEAGKYLTIPIGTTHKASIYVQENTLTLRDYDKISDKRKGDAVDVLLNSALAKFGEGAKLTLSGIDTQKMVRLISTGKENAPYVKQYREIIRKAVEQGFDVEDYVIYLPKDEHKKAMEVRDTRKQQAQEGKTYLAQKKPLDAGIGQGVPQQQTQQTPPPDNNPTPTGLTITK